MPPSCSTHTFKILCSYSLKPKLLSLQLLYKVINATGNKSCLLHLNFIFQWGETNGGLHSLQFKLSRFHGFYPSSPLSCLKCLKSPDIFPNDILVERNYNWSKTFEIKQLSLCLRNFTDSRLGFCLHLQVIYLC